MARNKYITKTWVLCMTLIAYVIIKIIFMEIAFMQFDNKKCFSKPRKDIHPIWNTFVKIALKFLNYATYYVYIWSFRAYLILTYLYIILICSYIMLLFAYFTDDDKISLSKRINYLF